MTAFLASRRDIVDKAYAVAVANGGHSEGPTGLRPEYISTTTERISETPKETNLCRMPCAVLRVPRNRDDAQLWV